MAEARGGEWTRIANQVREPTDRWRGDFSFDKREKHEDTELQQQYARKTTWNRPTIAG
jgi:hypothetical protein